MKKVAIISAGVLPVPAIKGGAVESLIDLFAQKNKINPMHDLTIFSIDDIKFKGTSMDSKYLHYCHIKQEPLLSFFDKLIYFFAKNILKRKNTTTFKNFLNRLHYYLEIRKALVKQSFDLVILENHCAEYLCLKPKTIYRKYYKKVILHSHNKPAHFKPFIKTMRMTKSIYCVSSALANLWKKEMEQYKFMQDVEYGVIKNGIRCDLFQPTDTRLSYEYFNGKLNLPKDKKIVLFAGRMIKEKGIFELIDAFKKLDNKYHLLLVGDYFYDSKSKNFGTETLNNKLLEIKDRYSFTGYVPYSKMPFVYNVADIVVLPSIEFDAAPLTLLEAICCCKPTISTKIGGIPEYAADCGVILLDVTDNLQFDIVKSIKKLEDDTFYEELVKRSLNKKESYDSRVFCARYDEMIDGAIEGRPL